VTKNTHPTPSLATQTQAARVLVFCVDDALFCLHVDWVEAVYPGPAVRLHALRSRVGQAQRFLAHAGKPALVIDLREVFDLRAGLAVPQRAHCLIVHSGSIALAIAVDTCLGVRELDLHGQTPVSSAVVRDGGFPVAHLVCLDGKMLAVLDPNHLLDGAARNHLAGMQRRAERFLARQAKLDALWTEICAQPSVGSVQAFSRLCARNGRTRAAAAARLVLKHLTGPNGDGEGASDLERFVGTLVQLSLARRDGELVIAPAAGTNGQKVVFAGGRIVDARAGAAHGTAAFHRLLAARPSQYHFVDTAAETLVGPIKDSTAALAIASLEALGAERRTRAR